MTTQAKPEVRSITLQTSGLEVRESNDTASVIVGYTAIFDQEIEIKGWYGGFRETIRPGAFTRVLSENPDVRALFNHDANNLLARTRNGTLSLKEDDKGLYVEITPAKTSTANDVLELIRRGDLSGMSFAFTIRKVVWTEYEDDKELDLREIVEIGELYDVGPVTYPAYDETTAELKTEHIPFTTRSASDIFKDKDSDTIKDITQENKDALATILARVVPPLVVPPFLSKKQSDEQNERGDKPEGEEETPPSDKTPEDDKTPHTESVAARDREIEILELENDV